MSTSEKPRDVSGVELLMNNHQGHKAEIDAREDNFADVYRWVILIDRSHNLYKYIFCFQLGQRTVVHGSLCLE